MIRTIDIVDGKHLETPLVHVLDYLDQTSYACRILTQWQEDADLAGEEVNTTRKSAKYIKDFYPQGQGFISCVACKFSIPGVLDYDSASGWEFRFDEDGQVYVYMTKGSRLYKCMSEKIEMIKEIIQEFEESGETLREISVEFLKEISLPEEVLTNWKGLCDKLRSLGSSDEELAQKKALKRLSPHYWTTTGCSLSSLDGGTVGKICEFFLIASTKGNIKSAYPLKHNPARFYTIPELREMEGILQETGVFGKIDAVLARTNEYGTSDERRADSYLQKSAFEYGKRKSEELVVDAEMIADTRELISKKYPYFGLDRLSKEDAIEACTGVAKEEYCKTFVTKVIYINPIISYIYFMHKSPSSMYRFINRTSYWTGESIKDLLLEVFV